MVNKKGIYSKCHDKVPSAENRKIFHYDRKYCKIRIIYEKKMLILTIIECFQKILAQIPGDNIFSNIINFLLNKLNWQFLHCFCFNGNERLHRNRTKQRWRDEVRDDEDKREKEKEKVSPKKVN